MTIQEQTVTTYRATIQLAGSYQLFEQHEEAAKQVVARWLEQYIPRFESLFHYHVVKKEFIDRAIQNEDGSMSVEFTFVTEQLVDARTEEEAETIITSSFERLLFKINEILKTEITSTCEIKSMNE